MTMHAAAAAALRQAVTADVEVAGVLIVGVSQTPGEVRFLVRDFDPAGVYDYQSPTEIKLPPPGYMPALARAAKLGASALFVHSHPTTEPRFSPRDDRVDEQLRSVFQIRTGSEFYGSLVVRLADGILTFTGRVWRDDTALGPIVLLREFGERFWFTSSLDAPKPLPSPGVYDRQVRAFGEAIQQILRGLHVGIVGAGGTGSALAEQLIRAGVGRISVADYQGLDDSNVTRVYGSSISQEGDRKVDILAANAVRIGLQTVITRIPEKVNRRVLEALQGCDLIFACTDDHSGRFDVSRLAYWCLIPVFDLGAQLDPVDARQQGIYSRVDIEMPGTPCAQCSGLSNPDGMLAEGLPEEERRDREREGYLPGQDNRDPAVIAFTTLSASLAFAELLLRVTGLGQGAPSRLMFYVHDRRLGLSRTPTKPHWCSDPMTWGAIRDGHRYLGGVWP